MAVVTILGAGMMGSALAVPLVDAGHEVRLVGTHLDTEIVQSLKQRHFHPRLKLDLPAAIQVYALDELEIALRGTTRFGLGVSSAGVAWAAEQLKSYLHPHAALFMITKGLSLVAGQLQVLPDTLSAALPKLDLAPIAIAGPCIAGELARRSETCVVVTGRDSDALGSLAREFSTSYYHPFTSVDVVGVEVCAALKNAYAMGIAFGAGLHEASGGPPGSIAMHNHESAIFAQAVLEMRRIIQLLGGDPESASGLAGVGDLDVTCNGGRTGRFGKLLGLGLSPAQAVERMEGATLECLEILQVMRQALPDFETRLGLDHRELPLLRHLTAVALDGEAVNVPFGEFFGGAR